MKNKARVIEVAKKVNQAPAEVKARKTVYLQVKVLEKILRKDRA